MKSLSCHYSAILVSPGLVKISVELTHNFSDKGANICRPRVRNGRHFDKLSAGNIIGGKCSEQRIDIDIPFRGKPCQSLYCND